MSKYIELYSGNRNRIIYPQPASYEIPFSAVLQNVSPISYQDPVVKGSVYYTFTLYPRQDQYAINGTFQPGTINYILYLDPSMNNTEGLRPYSYIPDFYKGYTIIHVPSGESRTIRSFDPTSGKATIDSPFTSISPGDSYKLYQGFPTNVNYLYIPTQDDNYNIIDKYELSYNGYYIVFETPNSNYSNSDNSNIFYRKISYYDYNYQIAYYETPLDFSYLNTDPPQTFTLRKTLPMERWTLPVTTYYNKIQPVNKIIGPLMGPVIALPNSASSVDNYYTGKYVYFYNNIAETYPEFYPQPYDSVDPISNLVFYPIYGLYYISAYNGTTKELSINYDFTKYKKIPLPTYQGVGYNVFNFVAGSGVTNIVQYFRSINIILNPVPGPPYEGEISLVPNYFVVGKQYTFSINLQDVSEGNELSPMYFQVRDNGIPIYTSSTFEYNLKTITFSFIPTTTNITFVFIYDPDPLDIGVKTFEISIESLIAGGIGYNSSSFIPGSGFTSITNFSQDYKATFNNIMPYVGSLSVLPLFTSAPSTSPDTFNISWCLRSIGNYNTPVYFVVMDNLNPVYTSPSLTSSFTCITFSITPTTNNVTFCFYYDPTNTTEPHSIEWNYFFVLDQSIQSNPYYQYSFSYDKTIGMNDINITTFNNNNFSPLLYNGTMVDTNQTVCYTIQLLSITLPNAPLKTGSRLAFYPYVYVELANVTAPNSASKQIIYSNNPNSNRALFIAPVTQLLQPEANTFITLSGSGMAQLIKFKPNDNLRFSVYLPDGKLFETLDIDPIPPYDNQLDLQIDAVFSIERANQSEIQSMLN